MIIVSRIFWSHAVSSLCKKGCCAVCLCEALAEAIQNVKIKIMNNYYWIASSQAHRNRNMMDSLTTV